MNELDLIRAEAIHETNRVVVKAQALERDLDRILAMLDANQVGRLAAIASTLAEHEARLTKLEQT